MTMEEHLERVSGNHPKMDGAPALFGELVQCTGRVSYSRSEKRHNICLECRVHFHKRVHGTCDTNDTKKYVLQSALLCQQANPSTEKSAVV